MLEALHSNEAYRRYYKENQLEDASEQCSGLRVVLVRVEKASGQSLIVFGLGIVNPDGVQAIFQNPEESLLS